MKGGDVNENTGLHVGGKGNGCKRFELKAYDSTKERLGELGFIRAQNADGTFFPSMFEQLALIFISCFRYLYFFLTRIHFFFHLYFYWMLKIFNTQPFHRPCLHFG